MLLEAAANGNTRVRKAGERAVDDQAADDGWTATSFKQTTMPIASGARGVYYVLLIYSLYLPRISWCKTIP